MEGLLLLIRRYIPCVIGALICLGVGVLASIAITDGALTWFDTLHHPNFQPPSSYFFPIWTVLYIMMGISAGLIYPMWHRFRLIALFFFIVQLFFNGMWAFVFFGLRSPDLGLIDLGMLWGTLLITVYFFYRIRPSAAYWLLPYFIWVNCALVLNASLLLLN